MPASLDALQEVVEAISGAIPVLVDGGIRRGTDKLALALLGCCSPQEVLAEHVVRAAR